MKRQSRLRVALVVLGLVGPIAALHLASRMGLQGPARADSLSSWLDDPAIVVATAARLLALVLSYYLLIVVLVTAVANRRESTHWLHRLLPTRSAAFAAMLLGAATVTIPLVSQLHTESLPRASTPLKLTPASESLRLTPEFTPESTSEAVILDFPDRASPEAHNGVNSAAASDWEVVSGESFWSIAEELVVEHLGRTEVEDDEVAPYWRRLIAANEDRLVEPGNPDLLLPGQQLVIPDPATGFPTP